MNVPMEALLVPPSSPPGWDTPDRWRSYDATSLGTQWLALPLSHPSHLVFHPTPSHSFFNLSLNINSSIKPSLTLLIISPFPEKSIIPFFVLPQHLMNAIPNVLALWTPYLEYVLQLIQIILLWILASSCIADILWIFIWFYWVENLKAGRLRAVDSTTHIKQVYRGFVFKKKQWFAFLEC